jgi:hypothetical protein
VSCASLKPVQTNTAKESQDSVVIKEMVTSQTVSVPSSEVTAKIAVASLGQLPEGASYVGRQGRASFKLTRVQDTVLVTSTCDSLAIQCDNYQKEITRLRTTNEKSTTQVQVRTFWPSVKKYAIGIVIGFVLAVVLRIVLIILKKV